MKIGILGATGTAGSAAVAELVERGHAVVALSRHPARAGEHRSVDVVSGDGLAGAFEGLEAVVECLNARGRAGAVRPVLVDGVARALDAAAAAGVAHAVSLSIVGCDRVPAAYYRVKVAQEAAVRAAPLATTIVRATQFHGLLDAAFAGMRRLGVLLAPRGTLQPIDPRDVAGALADAVERGPGPDAAIAGPEVLELRDLARSWREARGSRRPIVGLPAVSGVLRQVAAGALTDPAAPRGTRTWSDHLAS